MGLQHSIKVHQMLLKVCAITQHIIYVMEKGVWRHLPQCSLNINEPGITRRSICSTEGHLTECELPKGGVERSQRNGALCQPHSVECSGGIQGGTGRATGQSL